jgi:hypothetical protein
MAERIIITLHFGEDGALVGSTAEHGPGLFAHAAAWLRNLVRCGRG